MGRSVSYPSSALVAFTVLEVEDDDANEPDSEFEYEWLREDLRTAPQRPFHRWDSTMAGVAARTRSSCVGKFADFGVSV